MKIHIFGFSCGLNFIIIIATHSSILMGYWEAIYFRERT